MENDEIKTEDTSVPSQSELEQCRAACQEYLSGWQRAKADFINYKNEETRRTEEIMHYAFRSLLNDILPVLDSFDVALQREMADGQDEAKGLSAIHTQMIDILKKRGCEPFNVRPGDPFNPELHEALGFIKAEYPPGTIAEEIQRGWTFKGKVIRPARVRIVEE